ncbi:MAG: DNA polymerase III subunit delta' [Clostridia bacterium]|nr:DNA polymerase III subunit delta' [Clostridia bacterium]
MLFSEVFGHNKIKDVLIRGANSGRVGHAYIFEGPQGVGRLSMAKAFAMRLMCENPNDDDSCGICKTCSQCMSQNNPDLRIVNNQLYDPSKKSTDILVDTVRNMKREIYIKPYAAERKVYIVPNADTMNLYAQNSLLKVLEEPPEYCTIILIAENSNLFLPTILSRAPILKFFPLAENEVREYLAKSSIECDADEIDIAAKMCQGSIGKAKELLEDSETGDLRNALLDSIFALVGERRKGIYELMLLLKQNKDEFEFLVNVMQSVFRDLIYVKNIENHPEITNGDKWIKLQKFADSIGRECPIRLNEILFKYSDYFSKNISYGLIAQCLSLELWEAINDRGYRSKI